MQNNTQQNTELLVFFICVIVLSKQSAVNVLKKFSAWFRELSGSNRLDTWLQVKEVERARKYMFEWDAVIIQDEWLEVVTIRLGKMLYYRLQKWCEKIKWMCMGRLEKLISNHTLWHSWKLENKQGRSQEMTLLKQWPEETAITKYSKGQNYSVSESDLWDLT